MVQRRALKIILPTKSYNISEYFNLQTLFQRSDEMCSKLFTNINNPTHKLYNLLPPNTSWFINLGTLGSLSGLKLIQTGLRILLFLGLT